MNRYPLDEHVNPGGFHCPGYALPRGDHAVFLFGRQREPWVRWPRTRRFLQPVLLLGAAVVTGRGRAGQFTQVAAHSRAIARPGCGLPVSRRGRPRIIGSAFDPRVNHGVASRWTVLPANTTCTYTCVYVCATLTIARREKAPNSRAPRSSGRNTRTALSPPPPT